MIVRVLPTTWASARNPSAETLPTGFNEWLKSVRSRDSVQTKSRVNSFRSSLNVGLLHNDGGLDFAGGDHENVDADVGQSLEHFGSDTAVTAHANTDDAELGNARLGTQSYLVSQAWQNGAERGFSLR